MVIGLFSSGPSQSFAQFVYLLLESWFLSPIMDSVIQVVSSPLRTPRNAPEGQVLQCNTPLIIARFPCLLARVAFLSSIYLRDQTGSIPHQHEPTEVNPFQTFQTACPEFYRRVQPLRSIPVVPIV